MTNSLIEERDQLKQKKASLVKKGEQEATKIEAKQKAARMKCYEHGHEEDDDKKSDQSSSGDCPDCPVVAR